MDDAPLTAPRDRLDTTPGGASDEPETPVLVPPRALFGVTIAALFAIAATAVLLPGPLPAPQASLDLAFWRPSHEEREQMLKADTRLLGSRREDVMPLETESIASFEAYLARERTTGAARLSEDKEARWARANLEEGLFRLAVAGGVDAVRAAAVSEGRAIRKVVVASVAESAKAGRAWPSHIAHPPEGSTSADLVARSGGLGVSLAATGIGDDGQIDADEALLVEALVAQRFLEAATRLRGGPPEPPSDRRRLILAFRVEAHAALALARRLELLDALSELDPSYPKDFVAGVLLSRAGLFDKAEARFEASLARGEERSRSRANLAWVRSRR